MNFSQQNNYYEILEVAQDAPQHVIHEAFQRAKRTYSTDSAALYSMFSQEEAQQLMKMIEEAFAVLGNQTLRRAYDEKLAMKKSWRQDTHAEHLALDPSMDAPEQGGTPDWSSPASSEPTAHLAMDAGVAATTGTQPAAVTWGDDSLPTETPIVTSDNMGKTKFGLYELNADFEEEIQNQSIFDGSFIKNIREYKRVSETQMCDATRIGRNYLLAVESNNYSELPAPVFVRGFIIQIARVLGLDEKKVSTSYMKLLKESTN